MKRVYEIKSGVLQTTQQILHRFSSNVKGNPKAAAKIGVNLDKIQHYVKQRKILDSLRQIRETGERTGEIVSDLLQFCRKSQSNTSSADLHKLIDKTLNLISQDHDLMSRLTFTVSKLTNYPAAN